MKNQTVAQILYEIADLLDIKGEGFFVTRAYRMAAQTIEILDEDINKLVQEQRLTDIQGIGNALAKKITELVTTGKLQFLEDLKQDVPESLLTLLKIQSLGPKKVSSLYQNLGIETIDDLKHACQKEKVRDLDGFGVVTELNILRGIALLEKTSGRALLNVADDDGKELLTYLQEHGGVNRISIAGSLRRMKETIGDLDILVASNKALEIMEHFTAYPKCDRVLMKGPTKSSIILRDHLQVDLRVVEEKSFGAALQYFTGSKEHNVAMRSRALSQGYKLNEYGLFDKETEHYIAGKTEEDIYRHLGLDYIEPELRENRGELKAAENHRLPALIQYSDIRGDFHVHSNMSDGFYSIENIVNAARGLHYEFITITDHSQSLKVANGLSEARVKKKKQTIAKLNKQYDDITIYCGTECDIKADGSMDYNDTILQEFDIVYGGIHTAFTMDGPTATQRIITAMENPYVHAIAHPTCRMIGRRQPFDVDIEKIITTAVETNTFLEINAFPDRLDLHDIHVKQAKDRGAQIIIGSDSHFIANLPFIRYGVATARRGWLEASDVLNTYPPADIERILGVQK